MTGGERASDDGAADIDGITRGAGLNMRRLSSLDAQFFAAERAGAESHYCGLSIYDTPGDRRPITADTVAQRIGERIEHYPPLRWRVVTVPFGLDHPVFETVAVDPADHVREVELDVVDEQGLRAAVSADLKIPLDRQKPLWRVTVFHGLPGRTAVAFTLHHGVVDGISAKEVFGVLVDDATGLGAPPTIQDEPAGVVNRLGLAARAVVDTPGCTLQKVRNVAGSVAHLDQSPVLRSLPGVQELARLIRRDGSPFTMHAPRTRFNSRLSGTRSNGFATVSLEDVKTVKRHLGVTVNDVVLAACAGALRNRLLVNDELPDEPLLAYIPVSVRDSGHRRYGNAITSIIAPLPTHLDNRRDRVTFVSDVMKRAKDRTAQIPPTLMADVNDIIPTPVFHVAARGVMDLISSPLLRPPVNLIMSNVPGPSETLSLLGAPLLAHYPLSLIFDGIALNITVVSYRDGMDIGVVGDAEAVPDAVELVEDLRAEFVALLRLTAED